jgi:hypothetical protein
LRLVTVIIAVLIAALSADPAHGQPPSPAATSADGGASSTGAPQQVSGSADPGAPRRAGWVFLPGVTYTPDHGLTVAGAAMRYFRRDTRAERASSMVLSVEASVQGKGMVSLDPNVWLAGGDYHLGGSAWVSYLDYSYFGIGNDTRMADGEDFTAVRVQVRPELVRRIARHVYAGALYEFRHEEMTDVEDGGMLAAGVVPGGSGGLVSGLGLLLRWDSRDHSFSPRSGGVASLSPRVYSTALGSDFDFTRLVLQASWFFGLGGDHVVAVDGQVDMRGGDPPFSHMSQAGGTGLMRGMLVGRFRDQHFAAAQVEYRYPLFWRFGGVAFGGLGRVASSLGELDFSGLKYSVGGGLRFAIQQQERITVRLDVGKSNDDSAFYLALLEAF